MAFWPQAWKLHAALYITQNGGLIVSRSKIYVDSNKSSCLGFLIEVLLKRGFLVDIYSEAAVNDPSGISTAEN